MVVRVRNFRSRDTYEGSSGQRVLEQKSSENWKELDNESEDRKVERDAEREGEPNILAPFSSDWGITIWDPGIIFLDITLRTRWFRMSGECYALGS
ncbi:hypothetical protein Tco_0518049 [Tanacetum coccineum]